MKFRWISVFYSFTFRYLRYVLFATGSIKSSLALPPWFVLFRHPYAAETWRVGWGHGVGDDDKIWVYACVPYNIWTVCDIYFIYTIATSNKYLKCVFWIWTGVVACDETLEKFIIHKGVQLIYFNFILVDHVAHEKKVFFFVWPLVSSNFVIWCHWYLGYAENSTFDFNLMALQNFGKLKIND